MADPADLEAKRLAIAMLMDGLSTSEVRTLLKGPLRGTDLILWDAVEIATCKDNLHTVGETLEAAKDFGAGKNPMGRISMENYLNGLSTAQGYIRQVIGLLRK
jgi:hypothetical protein